MINSNKIMMMKMMNMEIRDKVKPVKSPNLLPNPIRKVLRVHPEHPHLKRLLQNHLQANQQDPKINLHQAKRQAQKVLLQNQNLHLLSLLPRSKNFNKRKRAKLKPDYCDLRILRKE